jgi:hypothetical protein
MSDDLPALQRRFFFALSDQNHCHGDDFCGRPRNHDHANDLAQARETPELSGWLVAGGGADVAQRLQVYADATEFRLLECLADDFPAVAAVLGEDFPRLAREYVGRHPPSHPSLRHLGTRFASFAAEHRLAQRWAGLGDLAALEWARVEAFDARDVPLLSLVELAAIAPDEWPTRAFRAAPPVRLLALRHPVHLVWRAVEDAVPVPPLEAERTHILVWRRGHVVCHRVTDAREAGALQCTLRGVPFADLCERIAGDGSLEQAAHDALGLLRQWIADGVLEARG